jgi:phage repressor protein C with HTH and peptisase S24 domain
LKNNLLRSNLNYLLDQENFSNKTLSDFIGVAPNSISHYRSGKAEPKIDALVKMSQYFGYSVDQLLNKDLSFAKSSELQTFNEAEPVYQKSRKVMFIRDIMASGGHPDGLTPASNDVVALSIPASLPDSIAMQVMGNSMDPVVCDGDIVIAYPVNEKTFRPGKIYIVETYNDGVTVKYVERTPNGSLRLSAANKSVYAPKEYPASGVRTLYLVYKKLCNV